MTKTIIANWKCHGRASDIAAWIDSTIAAARANANAQVILAAPYVYLPQVVAACASTPVSVAGQDVAAHTDGAYTGDVTAAMLADIGVTHVIIGHSERRAQHGETDAQIAVKGGLARAAGLTPILCVGEHLADRRAGRAHTIVAAQIAAALGDVDSGNLILAYEPVWAIGTGESASLADIADMFVFLLSGAGGGLAKAADLRMVYGGSVKPGNAAEVLAVPGVSGALVGAASLDPAAFAGIIAAA